MLKSERSVYDPSRCDEEPPSEAEAEADSSEPSGVTDGDACDGAVVSGSTASTALARGDSLDP